MKNTLIAIVLVLISITSSAQNIKLDSLQDITYAEIVPITLPWLKNSPSITRVYIKVLNTNMFTTAYFDWWIKYPVITDSVTINYITVASGSSQIPIDPTTTIQTASAYLYNYVAQSIQFNLQYAP